MSLSSGRLVRATTPNTLHFRTDVQDFFPDRRLWVHVMMTVAGWDDTQDTTPGAPEANYGANYPLDLIAGTYQPSTTAVEQALACGITGIQLLMGAGQVGHIGMIDNWVTLADATWSDADASRHVQTALCVCDDASSIVSLIKEYHGYAIAGAHPSIAKINGKYVIFSYGSRVGKQPSDWAEIRRQVAAEGIEIVVIGDLDNQNSQPSFDLNPDQLAPYFHYFEASWNFDWQSREYPAQSFTWSSLYSVMNTYRQPYVGSILPGYNRENFGESGAYLDARGTRYLRSQFEQFRATNSRWLMGISWNDITEQHELAPSSNWNNTRADICAFYSSLLRNVPFPRAQAELYVTTPQALFVGRSFHAEAMALNGGGLPVYAQIELFDAAGNLVDGMIQNARNTVRSGMIHGGMSGDATISASYIIGPEYANTWIYAVATLYAADGVTKLQTVRSAPIVIYAANAQPASDMWWGGTPRTMYYSIPARLALSELPQLSFSGSPVQNSTTASVTLGSGNMMKYVEVIQNTRQVHLGFSTTSFSTTVPLVNGSLTKQGQTINAAATGWYIARVVNTGGRVGYSVPRLFT